MKRWLRPIVSLLCAGVMAAGSVPMAAQDVGFSEGYLYNFSTDGCADVWGLDHGAPITVGGCAWSDPASTQRWQLTPDGFVVNLPSNRCIDVLGFPGVDPGAPITLGDCEWFEPGTDQRWQMTAEGFLVNLLSGRCIDVGDSPVLSTSLAFGTQLMLWDCEWFDPLTGQTWALR